MVDISILMARFRAMPPIRQAAIVGLLFFSFYIIYAIIFLSMPPADALQISLASSLLFMGIYYITSVIMLKKRTESKDIYGPKKGKRKS